MTTAGPQPAQPGFPDPFGLLTAAFAYGRDSLERAVLYADVMRERGNQYLAHLQETAPSVLQFATDVVLDGADLPRPVNYSLCAVRPPAGVGLDQAKRPFVVVDPRAGHGPGIGGFKADSEIGVALRAGHPCYFIGFLPRPVPGQTVEDVALAETKFLEAVIARHPQAEGRPVVVGNCQAGWQIMMAASMRPELFGPILIAGAPLSYWAGHEGGSPMRYSGGLMGGSWLTALWGDLGHGLFDGAWLVKNFEGLNPANTLIGKQYHLYADIDTEAPRYLGFEKWWGAHVLMNAGEMQYIVDKLFIGNRLATAEIVAADGTRLDLRNVASPIIVFCSKGDEITPPPQALGWILDLYDDVEAIRAHGQTIVYAVHESVGHLGIFVSGKVVRREHEEFVTNMDFIDVLPPGLYEAVIVAKDAAQPNAELIDGDYLLRFEPRTLDDVAAIVRPDPASERAFATVRRISETNLGLYRTFLQPWVQAATTEAGADWLRALHPLRLGFALFSDNNPFLAGVGDLARAVAADRHAVREDNVFQDLEHRLVAQLEEGLRQWGQWRDHLAEESFKAIYGSPFLQALAGLRADDKPPRPQPGVQPEQRAFVSAQARRLRAKIGMGGMTEAFLRSILYVAIAADKVADERAFRVLSRLRRKAGQGMSLARAKELLREQFLMLILDPEAALAALPDLLGKGSPAELRRQARDIEEVVTAAGALNGVASKRLAAVLAIYETAAEASPGTGGKARGMVKRVAKAAPDASRIKAPDQARSRRRPAKAGGPS